MVANTSAIEYRFDTRGQFAISEDDHLLELRCLRCGERLRFSAAGAEPEAIQAEIDAHFGCGE